MTATKIPPKNIEPDRHGHRTKEWFVRLPVGMVADDLKDPDIWSTVQGSPSKALSRHDNLYMVSADESFAVEARVTEATPKAAVLALQKIISMTARLNQYFADENYCVKWSADGGFCVIRKSDNTRMGSVFPSEALAIRHLQSLYPVNVE